MHSATPQTTPLSTAALAVLLPVAVTGLAIAWAATGHSILTSALVGGVSGMLALDGIWALLTDRAAAA